MEGNNFSIWKLADFLNKHRTQLAGADKGGRGHVRSIASEVGFASDTPMTVIAEMLIA